MKYCVYTRCFFENAYLTYFIEHYINLGFDKIIVLHSGGSQYNLSEKHSTLVDIYYFENKGNMLLQTYDYLLKNSGFDWILSVDNDEFLLLNKKYKNINDYVEEKLLINNKINAFYFRWGMIEKYDIESNNNFSHILKKYKIFSNNHIKTMFKKTDLISVNHCHHAELKNLTIFFEDDIIHNNQARLSINENSYKEHILIHMHTRSLHNLVLKSFNTVFCAKMISKKNEFIEFINTLEPNLSNDTTLSLFLKYIGAKAHLPFYHSSGKLIDMVEYDILNYDYEIIDSIEYIDILNCLNNNKINANNYFYFISSLSEKTINDKTFIYMETEIFPKLL
jgi:hypothetical protein